MFRTMKYVALFLLFILIEQTTAQLLKDSLENPLPGFNNEEKANYLNNLSTQYSKISPEKAMSYARQAYSYAQMVNNKSYSAKAMNNLANAFFYHEEYDSTLYYLEKAETIAKPLPIKKYLSECYFLYGRAYKQKMNFTKAISYFNESFKINEKFGYSTLNNAISILTGDINLIKGDYKQAISMIYSGLEDPPALDQELLLIAYDDLAIANSALGNYKTAYEYSQKYSKLKDEMIQNRRSERIAELDIKYQSEKKEKENEILKRDIEIMQQIQRNQQNIILFFVLVSALVIAIIIILSNRYRNKKITNEVLTQKNSRILKQNRKLETLSQKLISKNREVSEQNEKLDAIFDNAIVGIGFADQDQQYLYMNEKWCDMLGYQIDEVKSITLDDVIHIDDREDTLDQMKKLLNGELDEIRTEKRYIRKDGSVFWGELYASPVKDEMGHISYSISVVVDITERKIVEHSLIRSEAQLREVIATKDKFFSIIAHDLKNPLSVISNMSGHLLGNFHEFSDEKKTAYVQLINESSHILYKLLENLLEWSRAQTGKLSFEPKEFDLHELSENNITLFEERAKEKNIELETYIEENSVIVADYNMINTVLRNLVSNALKFTNPGGKVKVFSKRENGNYSLFVSDTGIGIEPLDREKLFRIDVSHSTLGTDNEEGTGLGLILCKEFIDKHNGKIEVESQKGEGTTFIVTLPTNINSLKMVNTEFLTPLKQ
jgi:PAS domain S-box-containing protein